MSIQKQCSFVRFKYWPYWVVSDVPETNIGFWPVNSYQTETKFSISLHNMRERERDWWWIRKMYINKCEIINIQTSRNDFLITQVSLVHTILYIPTSNNSEIVLYTNWHKIFLTAFKSRYFHLNIYRNGVSQVSIPIWGSLIKKIQ